MKWAYLNLHCYDRQFDDLNALRAVDVECLWTDPLSERKKENYFFSFTTQHVYSQIAQNLHLIYHLPFDVSSVLPFVVQL